MKKLLAISTSLALASAASSQTVVPNSVVVSSVASATQGTITSVAVTGANGIGVSGSPITSSGVIALSLGAITPTTVNGLTFTSSSITGGASNLTLTAGTGNNRTMALQTTTSGGVPTTFFSGDASQNATVAGNLTVSGGALTLSGTSNLTGGAGNMTILSGTGNSRTLTLQTTTSGGVATTALSIDASQQLTMANNTKLFTDRIADNGGSITFYTGGIAAALLQQQRLIIVNNASSNPFLGATGSCFSVAASGKTVQDTSSSGVVPLNAINYFGAVTLTASSATTYTASATNVIAGPPVASTNVTQTAPYSQYIVAGNVRWGGYGAGALTTDANGVITAASDLRLKDVQRNFASGLDAVRGLRPIVYRWNTLSKLDREHEYVGFGAQDVERVIPAAVGRNEDGYMTLSDRPILAATVNAIRELGDRPATLEIRAFEFAALLALALAARANLRAK